MYELSPFSVSNNTNNYSQTNNEINNKKVVGVNVLKRNYTSTSSASADNYTNNSNISKAPDLRHRFNRS